MKSDNKKSILFFGIFDPGYSRNRVLIRGFEENGYDISLCRVDPKKHSGIKKYIKLFKEYRKIRRTTFDYVVVAFPGHTVMWLAYLLFGRKVIFDVFISLYNSEIEDRKKSRMFSTRAVYYWSIDWFSMRLAYKLLIDTYAHRDFLSKKFGIYREKFIVVYVGSDDSVVHPLKKDRGEKLIVHFHGTGTPMQGVPYILRAAELLRKNKDIEFRMYGISGFDTENVHFFGRFPYEDMSSKLSEADVVLGIFGNTKKAQLVIPNKVFEGLAARKPVITAKTVAVLEIAHEDTEVILCEEANSKALAENIVKLLYRKDIMDTVAQAGHEMYKVNLTPDVLVKNLVQCLDHK